MGYFLAAMIGFALAFVVQAAWRWLQQAGAGKGAPPDYQP